MAYAPEVERWRPLVQKYFRPEDVDKALYVIAYESSGNPSIKAGGNEDSYGLFQLNSGGLGAGMSVQARQDPETNVRVAAQAVYGGSGWSPWGEGTEVYDYPYDPKTGKGRFGALGNHPYGGGSGAPQTGRSAVDPQAMQDYRTTMQRLAELDRMYSVSLWLNPQTFEVAKALKLPQPPANIIAEYNSLVDMATELEARGAAGSLDDIAAWYDLHSMGPEAVSAQNAAEKYAREFGARTSAANLAAGELGEQRQRNMDALASQEAWAASGQGNTPKLEGFMAMQPMKSGDELFKDALRRITEGLPDVPGRPLPPPLPSYQSATRKPAQPMNAGVPNNLFPDQNTPFGVPGVLGRPNIPGTLVSARDWAPSFGGGRFPVPNVPAQQGIAAQLESTSPPWWERMQPDQQLVSAQSPIGNLRVPRFY